MDNALQQRLGKALNKRPPGEFHFPAVYGAG